MPCYFSIKGYHEPSSKRPSGEPSFYPHKVIEDMCILWLKNAFVVTGHRLRTMGNVMLFFY